MSPKRPLRRFAAVILLAMAGLCASSASAQSAPSSSDADKVVHLLEGSGQKYKTYNIAAGHVWSIEELHGSNLKNVRILLGANEGYLVMGVIVAQKARMNVTSEFMHKLLRLSHGLDRVKIGFDDDEDLFVRIESPLRLLDAQDFKAQIDQVLKAADEVYKQSSPFIATQ